eukprot:CAMPEP_0118949380 /NCGR_PEP_ID=MMETSP1169-20130426/49521_1 /TAXON_ID=36882 /ORGANISM="Pyramimonas obovata, Strain CCMP722" /LENGTH=49 /DNA_ID= /DNA_START= /DNA_END= /DNA_ORIENTATION=
MSDRREYGEGANDASTGVPGDPGKCIGVAPAAGIGIIGDPAKCVEIAPP